MQKKQTNLPDWSAMMPLSLSADHRPVGVYRAVRQAIETGQLRAGAKLPPSRDLAKRFKLSRSTIVAAYEMLVADGFVITRQGSGSFVAQNVPYLSNTAEIIAEKPISSSNRLCSVEMPAQDEKIMAIFRRLLNQKAAKLDVRHYTYTDPRGALTLREAIATYLNQARGLKTTASQIFITSGTQQSLDLIMRAILPNHATILLEDPTYRNVVDALRFFDKKLHFIPHLTPLSFEQLPKADAIFVTPSKRFPLGGYFSLSERLALLKWANDHKSYIIEDDYDGEIRFEAMPLTAIQGLDDNGRVIYMGTFSKTLFAGVQCAYLIVPPQLVERVMTLRVQVDRRAITFVEEALADLIKGGYYAAHLRRTTKKLRENRNALIKGLKQAEGAVFQPLKAPSQGLHLTVFLNNKFKDTLFEHAARNCGFPVRAISRYCENNHLNGILIGYCGFTPDAYEKAGQQLANLALQMVDMT